MIREVGGRKIGFVGVLTPSAITSSNPKNFWDENGNSIYSLLHEDRSGQALYDAIQNSVDAVMMVDNEAVMDYISETLGGVVGEEYSDPYGQGRITAVE